MRYIFLSFDLEEFDIPEEYGVKVPDEIKMGASAKGTEAILRVLNERNIEATFFTTAEFAINNQDLIKRLSQKHEIASHGFYHSQFETSHLAESRTVIQQISRQKIEGFRMARLAFVPTSDIIEAGYKYDSSINPIYLPKRYNNLNKPVLPHRLNDGLLQIPISTVPFCRFPLFWLSFKNLPIAVYLALAIFSLKHHKYFSMYTHPWEYNSVIRDTRWNLPNYIKKYAGEKQQERLTQLLDCLAKYGEFRKMKNLLEMQ